MFSPSYKALYICLAFKSFAVIYRCYQSVLQPPPQPQRESSHSVHDNSADSHTHTHTPEFTKTRQIMYARTLMQESSSTQKHTHIHI